MALQVHARGDASPGQGGQDEERPRNLHARPEGAQGQYPGLIQAGPPASQPLGTRNTEVLLVLYFTVPSIILQCIDVLPKERMYYAQTGPTGPNAIVHQSCKGKPPSENRGTKCIAWGTLTRKNVLPGACTIVLWYCTRVYDCKYQWTL